MLANDSGQFIAANVTFSPASPPVDTLSGTRFPGIVYRHPRPTDVAINVGGLSRTLPGVPVLQLGDRRVFALRGHPLVARQRSATWNADGSLAEVGSTGEAASGPALLNAAAAVRGAERSAELERLKLEKEELEAKTELLKARKAYEAATKTE